MVYNNPFVSMTFIKGFLGLDLENLKDKIRNLTEKIELSEEEITYLFTLTILEYHFFFNENQEVREYLLYESAKWSSKQETKTKRPTSFSEEFGFKQDKLFTKLIKSLINALIVKHEVSSEDIKRKNTKQITFNVELNNYLLFFNEISCIKRDRFKK